ncbi:ugtp-1 [Symbiodinium sp. CCMP2592]|nr:ugtp-1 [Symbiodinium sp. CCMP2592]
MSAPKQFLPYLPTVGSIRSRHKLDRSVARWRPTDPLREDSLVQDRWEPHQEPQNQPSLVQRLREVQSVPTLPALPQTSDRQTSSLVNLWRDARDLLSGKEAELPILVPPPAHRAVDLGQAATTKPSSKKRGSRRTLVEGSGFVHIPEAQKRHLRLAHLRQGSRPAVGTQLPRKRRRSKLPKSLQFEAVQPPDAEVEARDNRQSLEKTGLSTAQQGALEVDRAYVARQLAQQVEATNKEASMQRQAAAVADRWWSSIFLPVPAPRQLLPEALVGQEGLVNEVNDPAKPVTFKAKVKLAPEEIEEIVRLCRLFAGLTQPETVEVAKGDSGSEVNELVLNRPSFCQLLLALGISPRAQNLVPRYHRVVNCFDAQAKQCLVSGLPVSGGMISGLALPSLPEKPDEGAMWQLVNDSKTVALMRLFGSLLEDMATNPLLEGQDMVEALPRAKKHFFFSLLPAAQAYADARRQLLHQKAVKAQKQAVRWSPALEEPSLSNTRKGDRSVPTSGSSTRPTSVSSHVPKDMDAESEMTSEAPSQTSSPTNRRRTPRSRSQSGRRVPPQTSAPAKVEDEPDNEPPSALQPLPPEMLKAEFLQSQMLEPEILSFGAMFLGIFQVLFNKYHDFPTSACASQMSISGFLRFCFDFGLFPSVVDLQTIQQLYGLCAAEGEKQDAKSSSTDRGASPAPTKSSQKKRISPKKLRKQADAPNQIFWNGQQVPMHLGWLTHDFAHHSEQESKCVCILSAINDWMKDRMWTPADVFNFLDINASGLISTREFIEGVKLMRLKNLPSDEELRRLLPLLMSADKGLIAPRELHQALAVIAKQKHKLDLAANFFLKSEQDMSMAEWNASHFFRDLVKVMEKNSWSPERLFAELGGGKEAITKQELEEKARVLLRVHCGRSPALEVAQPFDILDVNGDGVIEREEFVAIIVQLLKALAMQGKEDSGRRRRQLQAATVALAGRFPIADGLAAVRRAEATAAAQNTKTVELFGLHQFIECLLLMAFEVIGVRGTSTQAQQPTITKAVWLLLYLRWQYELKLKQANEKKEQESAWAEKLGVSPDTVLDVLDERSCHYKDALHQLFEDLPELFKDVPFPKQVVEAEGAVEVSGPCQGCGRTRRRGWGTLVCPECSDNWDVLEAFWQKAQVEDPCGKRMNLIQMLPQVFKAPGGRIQAEGEVLT